MNCCSGNTNIEQISYQSPDDRFAQAIRNETVHIYIRSCDHSEILEDGHTHLGRAIEENLPGLVDQLLAMGADPNQLTDGIPPIILAIRVCSLPSVLALVYGGADVNCTTEDGLTPLKAAKKMDSSNVDKDRILKALKIKGADQGSSCTIL